MNDPATATPRRILLLSVSAGAGHVRAAEAILAAAAADAAISATHLDVMNFVPRWFRKFYTDGYIGLVNRSPSLWKMLYAASDRSNPDGWAHRIRRFIERRCTRALRREIATFAPDAIICTHFMPAEIVARDIRNGKVRAPLWVQITDFDLHRMWVQRGVKGYFAGNDEVAFRLQAHGVPADAMRVTGIPVMPAFAASLDRASCAQDIGADPARLTVLLMAGGAGLGALDEVARTLLETAAEFQLIVMAGRNAAALARLQALAPAFPGRLFAHGFTRQPERLMACADLAITKPGGLSTSECLAMGLPMIFNSAVPGQEERNADYLLAEGVAVKAMDSLALAYQTRRLLSSPELLAVMRVRCRALNRASASAAVLEAVLANP